jgi:glycosyltransferase involved in cell wall biosynthesis
MNTSKHFVATIDDSLRESGIEMMGIPVNTDIRLMNLARNFFFATLPYNAERFISPAFDDKLQEVLKGSDFDIIQLEGLYLAPYLPTIRRGSGARVVMRAHNVEHEIWARAYIHERGLKRLYIKNLSSRIRNMELGFLNSYDAMVPITDRDGKVLQKLGCHLPLQVVPTGVDAATFRFSYDAMDFPSVFHIGALDWIPNQEGINWFLEEVWGKVLDKFPDVKFYIAGRNAPARIRELSYPNLVFLGEVEDAYEFIRSRAVMIVPILSGSGMRIKIVEGMASGRAIVTTTIGTEGIPTTHGKDILIADEPGQFADEVCRLLGNLHLYREIGGNAREFIEREYDNRTITRSLIRFYEKLIS